MDTTEQATAGIIDVDILALTAWAEARGDFNEGHSSVEERIAVMSVIRNRVIDPAWWGNSYRTVCLKHAQFSSWLDADNPNHAALIALALKVQTNTPTGDPLFEETRFLADGIRRGFILDRVGGADFYYAPKGMTPPGSAPAWAKQQDGTVTPPLAIVGDQHFYKLGPR